MRVFLFSVLLCFVTAHTNAVAQTYKLRTGDRVAVSVWQDPKLDREVIVRPDGGISFPLAGHVRAAGSSLQTLESRLKQRLGKLYTEDLDITAALIERGQAKEEEEELEETTIYITGEVRNPGQFLLKKETTVLQAIALSGGLGPFAAKKRIQVRRQIKGGDVVLPFNFKEVESGRDLVSDIYLKEGDVIFVPERGLFR